MDALSDVLSLLKLKSYVSGGFVLDPKVGFDFHSYRGMKCYAVGSGSCWLSIESAPAAVRISEGDCVLLPRACRSVSVSIWHCRVSSFRVKQQYTNWAKRPCTREMVAVPFLEVTSSWPEVIPMSY